MAITTTFSLDDRLAESLVAGLDGRADFSNVIALANGGFAVVYSAQNGVNTVPRLAIYDSIEDADPVMVTDFNDPDLQMQGEPVLTQIANGDIVVAWERNADIRLVTAFVDSATGVVKQSNIGANSLATASDPEITALGNTYAVTFSSSTVDGAVILDDEGGFGGQFQLASTSATDISVARLAGGRVAFAYTENGNVKVEVFTDDTTPSGVGQLAINDVGASSTQIVGLPDGGFAVVFADDSLDGTPGIAMRIFDDSLVNVTPNGIIFIDQSLQRVEADPEITVLANGYILVTFTTLSDDGAPNIVGSLFTAGGTPVAPDGLLEFPIAVTGDVESHSSVAALGAGIFVTTWTDGLQGNAASDGISARIQELVRVSQGNDDNDEITGDALRDIISGGGGGDVIRGGGAADQMSGGFGDDRFVVFVNDLVAAELYDGGDQSDTVELVVEGLATFDFRATTFQEMEKLVFVGEAGGTIARFNASQFDFDTVTFGSLNRRTVEIDMNFNNQLILSGVTVLDAGSGGDAFVITGGAISETVVGSSIVDRINGNDGSDILDAGGGNDVLDGGADNDQLFGGDGNDVLKGGAGNDEIDGEADVDRLDWSDATGDIIFAIDPFGPVTVFAAGIGSDTVSNIEDVIAGSGNDRLTGTIGQAVANRLDGGAGDDLLNGGRGNDVLIGGLGVDTLDLISANSSIVLTIDPSGSGVVSADGIDTDTFFDMENVRGGSAGDVLTGNLKANKLEGGLDNDVLAGGLGNDVLDGGDGLDMIDLSAATSIVTLTLNAAGNGSITAVGIDTDTFLSIESVRGGQKADKLTGNGQANTLDGGLGDDTLSGGLGDDVYVVDSIGDKIIETAGGGSADRVTASVSYALAAAAQVEFLTTVDGAGFQAINLVGNDFGQTIQGNAGVNRINGAGGNDTMQGFGGDDFYYVDTSGDVVVEVAGGGNDRILSSINLTLAAGVSIELLTTTNSALTTALTLVGNALAQTVQGNAGANILNGGGGKDILQGLAGDDRYFVDSPDDVVLEAANGGNDRVSSVGSYILAAGAQVEQLTTTNTAATVAVNLVGNAVAQTIQGNAGANTINGGGGKDILQGFGGADKYFVDSADDIVMEAVGGGFDRISTSASYVMTANAEIELLTTTNAALTTVINMTGNVFAQTIQGNAGANLMNGGAGNDILQGFAGKDGFLFNTKLGANNIDRIVDFSVVDDTIRLENAIFTKIVGTGVLTAQQFASNLTGTATDALDRIIYETDTGKLFYDGDGLGGANGVQFALITPNLVLTNADFLVV